MEVILLERVGKLGSVGDVVTVKSGYARNFLIPQGKALRATAQNKALFQDQKEQIEKENSEKRAAAQEIAVQLDKLVISLIRQSGEDGRLFGSVTARDIAQAIVEAGISVIRSNIVLSDAIKSIGMYPVQVSLHPEVAVIVNVNVARTETEAEDAARAFLKKAEKVEPIQENAQEVAAS